MKRLAMITLAALMLVFGIGGGYAEYSGVVPQSISDLLNNGNFANLTIDIQVGRGNSYLILNGSDGNGTYEAHYTFGGDLSHYSYTYADGCAVSYSREGDIFMGDHFKTFDPGVNGTLEWMDGEWKRHVMEPNGESWESVTGLPDSLVKHNPETSHPSAPKAYSEATPYIPPQDVMDAYSFGVPYRTIRDDAVKAFPATCPETGSVPGYKDFERNGHRALMKTDGAYGMMVATYNKRNGMKLYEVYVGTLCFNVQNKWCVLAGHPQYGACTRGFYDWETGKLEEFLVETPDKELIAGFTNTNVLQSYEIWSRTEGRWEFWDGQWAYSPDSSGSAELEPTTPTEEVLKKILRIPGVAVYETECATSVSKVADTTVPFIVADASALGADTTVTVAAEKTSETETVYDITLDNDTTEPTGDVTLYLPYPNGMTAEIAADYDFAVVHEESAATTTEMSTVAGSVECTAYGLKVTTDSFSPFKVDWGKADAIADKYPDAIQPNEAKVDTGSLPQTGDTTNMALLLGVLAASVCALALVLRKRSVCR